ncbi:T9SS type A sorting domain-containing protein, partial [bacterium]|nr:T9SS type A sorting domain-containing protein [bacterium]
LDCENKTGVYDPATGTWSDLESNIPAKRSGHAAAVVNNKIYVFGGYFQGTLKTATYELDPATTNWTTKTDMPAARAQLAASTVGGLIYVVGGNDNTNDLTTVEIYDPSDDSWAAGDSMNVARSDFGIGYLSQYGLYAAGGTSSGSPLISMEMLNFPPSPPQNFDAELDGALVNLTWRPNSEIDLYRYYVYRSTTSGFTPTPSLVIAQISPPDTSYTDLGYVEGVQNYYKIVAVDDYGLVSDPSDEDSVLTPLVDLELLFGTTDQQRAPDDTFNLAINVQGSFTGKNVFSLQYKIAFDSSQIEAVDIDTSGFTTPVTFEYYAQAGTLGVSLYGSDTLTGGGYSFNARFHVKGDALRDTTTLSFVNAFVNEGSPALLSVSTSDVRILPTYGDATLDQTLTSLDASYVLKYTVGEIDFVAAQFERGDVSYNGSVTAYDAWLILQKVVGNIASFPVEDSLLSKVPVTEFIVSIEPVAGSENLAAVKISSKQLVENIAAFEIHLNYKSDAVSFLEYSFAEGMDDLYTVINSKEPGILRLAAVGQPYTELKEDFLVFTFRISDDRVKADDFDITHFIINETDVLEILGKQFKAVPATYSLHQNYPNPFNPETRIDFQIPKTSDVTLKIFNILGQEIKTLIAEQKQPGFYSIRWDGTNDYGIRVASGMYIYRIKAGTF